MQETRVWSLDREDTWRSEQQPTPVFSPIKSHGQRSLAGYSPYEVAKSQTWVSVHIHTHTHTHTKEYSLSRKNEWNNAISSKMDGPTDDLLSELS